MTGATFIAIVWRLAAIAAVVGIIIGRIKSLRARTKNGGPQNPENPREP